MKKVSEFHGFTIIEVVVAIGLLMLMYATLGRAGSIYKEHVLKNRVIVDLVGLVAAIEKYKEIHGDYPRLLSHISTEENSKILWAALRGSIDPFGVSIPANSPNSAQGDGKRSNLVSSKIKEANSGTGMKFVDQFGRDYLYYYATRSDVNNSIWTRDSFLLISTGVDGISTLQVGIDGKISQDKGDDMVADNGGIL
ncbi:MAG: hypothetical protein LBI37_01025 [Puniceicoccales bacterium]|nr:hypothetical protein [Puniceicoccales bacterium]